MAAARVADGVLSAQQGAVGEHSPKHHAAVGLGSNDREDTRLWRHAADARVEKDRGVERVEEEPGLKESGEEGGEGGGEDCGGEEVVRDE